MICCVLTPHTAEAAQRYTARDEDALQEKHLHQADLTASASQQISLVATHQLDTAAGGEGYSIMTLLYTKRVQALL